MIAVLKFSVHIFKYQNYFKIRLKIIKYSFHYAIQQNFHDFLLLKRIKGSCLGSWEILLNLNYTHDIYFILSCLIFYVCVLLFHLKGRETQRDLLYIVPLPRCLQQPELDQAKTKNLKFTPRGWHECLHLIHHLLHISQQEAGIRSRLEPGILTLDIVIQSSTFK